MAWTAGQVDEADSAERYEAREVVKCPKCPNRWYVKRGPATAEFGGGAWVQKCIACGEKLVSRDD